MPRANCERWHLHRGKLSRWVVASDERGRIVNSARPVIVTLFGVWAFAVNAAFASPASTTGVSQPDAVDSPRKDPVELRWVRLEGAELCPPKGAFEAALQKRVGRTSFSERGSRVLTVTLSNEKGPFRVVLSLKQRASDAVESKQELFSYSSQCDEVFAATVLSVALLLNPDEMDAAREDAIEESDSDFFDPPSSDVGLGAPSEGPLPPAGEPRYEIPVAPRPWARREGAVTTSLLAGIEQLPEAAVGLSVRTEWPLERSWLLWLSADWLQTSPAPAIAQDVTVNQTSGWAGGAWLPYDDEWLEVHLLGGLGLRQLTATLTAWDPRYHLALQLGVGMVVKLSNTFALDGRASAVVPLRTAPLGAWVQPAVGGQLQLGVTIGIPNPAGPN